MDARDGGVINLDDTTNCPTGSGCASCRAVEDLMVITIGTLIGVLCATVCVKCVQRDRRPRYGLAPAVQASLEHCGHLGITADEMAEAML